MSKVEKITQIVLISLFLIAASFALRIIFFGNQFKRTPKSEPRQPLPMDDDDPGEEDWDGSDINEFPDK